MKDRFLKEKSHTIKSISDFLNGTGGDWDWDHFTSISLRTPLFNSIRKEAGLVDLPLDYEGERILAELLNAAEQAQP